MGTHLIPTASHKGEVGEGGGGPTEENTTTKTCMCSQRRRLRRTHVQFATPTALQTEADKRLRASNVHLTHIVARCWQVYSTNPAVRNLNTPPRLKHRRKLVQKHLRQKGTLDNRENVFVYACEAGSGW